MQGRFLSKPKRFAHKRLKGNRPFRIQQKRDNEIDPQHETAGNSPQRAIFQDKVHCNYYIKVWDFEND